MPKRWAREEWTDKDWHDEWKDCVRDYELITRYGSWEEYDKWRRRVYSRKRRAKDPQFRMAQNLRSRVRDALKGKRVADVFWGLTGCVPCELREYIKAQFVEGMSWENYGKWHVDHIKPCASFDLTDPIEQRECFHYTNLQPLWASDNIRKGDKW